ncbi:D-alanyl-D-alanine carboxypeptidase family protein [Paenibacillus marinisediminis]
MSHLKRRITAILVVVCLICNGLPVLPQQVHAISVHIKPRAHHVKGSKESSHKRAVIPNTRARGAALVDVTSGRVLFHENGNAPMPMASTTKIMTAIVAIELGNLHDVVKTSAKAVGKEGSSIYLRLGEEMTLENMLYGLMLRSGNDAAVAIAEHIGGSEEGFVYLMNRKAEALGLDQTHFRNPHGLDAKGHVTSAIDLAKLSAYALHNATFREIVKTKQRTAPNPIDKWDYKWMNKNKMLRFYEGADGVKTGYTSGALRCLVSSATRNGQQLTAVTLNDGSDWADHQEMLNYGFKNFPLRTIVSPNQTIEGYPFLAAQEVKYPLSDQEQGEISYKVKIHSPHSLDYKLGHRGMIDVYWQDKKIVRVPFKQ